MLHKDVTNIAIVSKLPKDLNRYVLFRGLTGKEIQNSLGVCKQWKEISEEIVKKTAHQQFYLVGSSIPVATRNSKHGYIFLEPRTDAISAHELNTAFPKNGKVKLFLTENEALHYSYSLRVITDVVNQPAIYKVQFLREIPLQKNQEHITINLYYGQPLLLATNLTRKYIVRFFETDVDNVIPISGTLKVSLVGEHHYKEYATIDYRKYPETISTKTTPAAK